MSMVQPYDASTASAITPTTNDTIHRISTSTNEKYENSDEASDQEELARMVIEGNIVGALSIALDMSNTSVKKRSIVAGIGCLKNKLTKSDNEDVLRAVEILDNAAENLGLF
eukprot:6690197-Ditylum_brightwellii.AAC.1